LERLDVTWVEDPASVADDVPQNGDEAAIDGVVDRRGHYVVVMGGPPSTSSPSVDGSSGWAVSRL
jgi:hypothetical protein